MRMDYATEEFKRKKIIEILVESGLDKEDLERSTKQRLQATYQLVTGRKDIKLY